jgi:hypothetical protein
MDIYSTRAQLAAIDIAPREYGFLNTLFGKDEGTVEDEKAIFDVRKGSRKMAPMVKPGAGGVLMNDRDGYETKEIEFCCIAPERVVEDINLKTRMFGEKILGGMPPEQRARKYYAKDLQDMLAAIDRREEWMIRQILLYGKLEIFTYTNEGRNKNANMVADFNFTNNYAPTPGKEWDQSGADLAYDMEAMYDMAYDGNGEVTIMILAKDVWTAMRNNAKYMKTFDYLHVNMGEVDTKYEGKGLRYLGRNHDGVDMYSCNATFVDDDGMTKQVVPSGKIIAGSKGLIKKNYGPITYVEGVGANADWRTAIKKVLPYKYGLPDGTAIHNRLTSCPMMMPYNVDSWVVGTVL